jgi:MFS transporter, SHS family, lactate transporter
VGDRFSAVERGLRLFFNFIGWRGMLWIGVLPAVVVLWVRRYVKEPEIWTENRRRQRVENREVHAPLFSIFKSVQHL